MSIAPRPAPADELLEHGDGLIEMDSSWVIVRVNAAQERTTGKPRSETLGRVFWEVWPDVADLDGSQWRAYHRCMAERVPVELEDHYAPFDVWFHITAHPTSTGGIAVSFRDVTRRKRAEQSVRAERDFSTAILDTLATLVVVLDPDARIVRFNAACERATGFTEREVLGKSVFELFIPDADLPGARATFRQLSLGGFPNQHRNRWRTKDGAERLLDWSNTALANERGQIQFVIGTGVDVTEREQAIEALRESEERFRSVFESAAVGVGRVSLEGRIVRVNEAFARIVDYTPEELGGMTFQQLTHPDDLAADLQSRDELVAGRIDSYRMDKRYLRRDGSPVWVGLSVGLARDAVGRPGYFSVVVEDVSARKAAEEALRQNEQRFSAIFDDVAVGVVEVDEQDRFIAVNRRFCAMLGYARDELLGRTVHDLTAPEDREVTYSLNGKMHTGELNEFEYEKRYLRRDGARLWVQVNVRVVRDAHGRFVRTLGTAQDVTERRRTLAALRDSEAKFRSVFEQAATGMGRVRFSDARWIDVNEAFCRMLGRSREELLRTPWPEITHPEDVEPDLVPFRRMSAGELDSYTIEKRFLHADGHYVWTKLTLSLVRDEDERPAYEIAVIEDIGDRKRAETALREADQRKNEFLGMLSHELRNPLAPIRNALYLLDHTPPEGPQARRAKDIVRRQVAHLTRLVDDLLDVTRIARGKIELRREELDLGELVRRAAEDYRPVLQGRGLDLALDVPSDSVHVDGDPARLTQVFGNLLSNAAKFTPAGGRVSVSLRTEGDGAVVHVRDTGPGISPELLPTLFEPFTQGAQTLARAEGGLGLGLSLVKGLVTLHGGEVIAARAPEGGADFLIRLDLFRPAPAVDRSRPAAAPPPGGTSRHRVLVVDDNRDAAESLRELMELLGHEAGLAYDGPSALAEAGRTHPDLVLCDIGLPGMDGYQVARELRARHHGELRLVALSGYAQPEDVDRALEAGFDAHVAKPPDPEQLARLLE